MLGIKRKEKPDARVIVNQVLDRLINENNKKIMNVPECRQGHYVSKGLGLSDAKAEINEILNKLKH